MLLMLGGKNWGMDNPALKQPRPLEFLRLPNALDGSSGRNRGNDELCANDVEAIELWLSRVEHSHHTYRSYRKEIERLLLFCVLVKKQPLSSLSAHDLSAYKAFLKDPQPAPVWCGGRRPRDHPDWRPFEKKLTPASQNQALVILQNAFGFFTDSGYWRKNPGKLVSGQDLRYAINKSEGIERYIDQDCWRYLWGFIRSESKAARTNNSERRIYERNLLLFSLLYLQAPRVSELANARMGDLYLRRGHWWWEITGKGNKTASVPFHPESLAALRRYRAFFGFPDSEPAPGEKSPLLGHLDSPQHKALSADSIWRSVKTVCSGAAAACPNPQQATLLRRVSTHWLRHTSITHQAESGVELRYLQDIARHASIATTQKYLHAEERRWVAEFSKHRL